ncbi:UDP-N-acetylmuramate dehydrogenase [Actinomyces minihominis]|uniref:UDP-N-acetylmuramate dehydrogenase n=1 Tax=Actinomyces minihominis TaxID=2002838 RepID=UPI000C07BECA|nr:UDP-N-acetylmuramate dehydrogenase [Actinomyces minihominis]
MEFAELTTLRTGGSAPPLLEAMSEAELVEAITSADARGEGVLVIGRGSHLVVSESGWDGLLIRDARQDISEVDSFVACGGSTMRATAGTDWDTFVQSTLDNDLAGLEMLSGIPGTVGAAPVQNLGAYGQEVAQTIAQVRALDRESGLIRTLSRFDMHFGYRTSIISRSMDSTAPGEGHSWGPTGRWVVLEVTFQLRSASLSEPIRYQSLADRLGVELGTRVPAREVREQILKIRRETGMLWDPEDSATWSVGSYFRNPIVSDDFASKLPGDLPRFPVRNQAMFVSGSVNKQAPQVQGKTKLSAAWMIEAAGFHPGFKVRDSSGAALSDRYVLAITNQGEATAAEVHELASAVRDKVRTRFGVTLDFTPVTVA